MFLISTRRSSNGDSLATLEVDENLIRRDLTLAQRAKLIAKRKAAYEAAHPETKHGGARRGSSGQVGQLKKDRFTADTAAKSGTPERSIRRDATRAKALGADLDRVAGTSLDKGAELDVPAALPAEVRAPLIQRAAAGKNVSALRSSPGQEPKPAIPNYFARSKRSVPLGCAPASENPGIRLAGP